MPRFCPYGANIYMFAGGLMGWTDRQVDVLTNWVYVATVGTDGNYVTTDSHTSPKNKPHKPTLPHKSSKI